MNDSVTPRHIALGEALQLLRSAIEVLDREAAPGHIAAHVDLAAHELEQAISALGHSSRKPESGGEDLGKVCTS